MKAFYDRFYKISDNENISDRVMIFRIILSVAVILLCLFGMTFIACAYYEYDLSIRIDHIQSAVFKVDVTAEEVQSNSDVTIDKHNVSYTLNAEKDKEYSVTISRANGNTATTGFCIVGYGQNNDRKVYHTLQIGRDGDSTRDSVTFKIKFSQTTDVDILPWWGTSSMYDGYASNDASSYYITDGKVLTLP